MEELFSNNIGVSLEAALQESKNQTVLLSDIRDNSEAHRKADEKTLEQLKKLQQASTQTLEVAKAQKQQTKESSTTLKSMQEATNSTNAIVAKRQISTLNLLNTTINSGLNVVNQKMFTIMESLGSTLAGAFTAVGRSLENKIYSLTGSLSIILKPIVGTVKVGFAVMTKLISIPLTMLWNGIKKLSDTFIGKMVLLGTTLYLANQFFTKTDIGQRIGNWIESKKNDPSSYIGKMFSAVDVIVSTIKWSTYAIIASQTLGAVKNALEIGKTVSTGGAALLTALGLGSGAAAKTLTNKTAPSVNRYVWDGTKPTATPATTAKSSRFAGLGSKMLSKGNIASLLGVAGLDYLANKTENNTLSGGLHLGGAALSGAAMGSLFGPVGALIGAGLGVGSSLLFGEGGAKLFGSSEETNEVKQLAQMQNSQRQASTAQIDALENIAEAIHDSNKILTKVVEKQNTDAQPKLNRHEASTNEQNRHADAEQTNKLLNDISGQLSSLTEALSKFITTMANKNTENTMLGFAPNIGR